MLLRIETAKFEPIITKKLSNVSTVFFMFCTVYNSVPSQGTYSSKNAHTIFFLLWWFYILLDL